MTDKSEKLPKAKSISKAAKLLCAFGVIATFAIKWAGILPNAGTGEIVAAWSASYALAAGTVDANIIIDKFAGGKNND